MKLLEEWGSDLPGILLLLLQKIKKAAQKMK
jgi:hypothetical protein